MNLFEKPSLDELQNLISKSDTSTPVHNIVVDYDGEVLIDPELKQPEVDLNRFKFRMQLSTFRKDYIRRGSKWMQNLMKNLVYGWQGKTKSSKVAASMN